MGCRTFPAVRSTTDARELVLTRYTELNADLRLLLARMKIRLPQQPPPKIRVPLSRTAALR